LTCLAKIRVVQKSINKPLEATDINDIKMNKMSLVKNRKSTKLLVQSGRTSSCNRVVCRLSKENLSNMDEDDYDNHDDSDMNKENVENQDESQYDDNV
jgi:hypothetical protein